MECAVCLRVFVCVCSAQDGLCVFMCVLVFVCVFVCSAQGGSDCQVLFA